jgi:hypothetical protein
MSKTPYERLIEKVREIDEDAANYLNTEARKLSSFSELHCPSAAIRLLSAFTWRETPQKHDYWFNIYRKLQDQEEKKT